ncbi:type IV pilin protein [Anaeromyxobacter oryzae]|uniref:Lipoprotein n=1 Tax=Anaeromyxobacter oryzae TaxID=2918170 RepID=A0ABM7WXK7_9BACT|nr:hypothetical protein [Anaeromyxobacter oryzae]BDG04210.1 hypothetical protein AMOR_32060 [Anaeromyxobacter oryzae]
MFTNRRFLAVAFSVLTVSCATRYSTRPISPQAAAAFSHAQVDGVGGSLVIDAEKMRELGFRPSEDQAKDGDLLLDLAVALLPAVAAEMKDDPAAAVLARSAVLLALTREWAVAPHVQRLGVVVQVDPEHPDKRADSALVLVAVREGEKENREMLQALGAAVRAVAGREVVKSELGHVCLAREANPELPFQVCIHPGPGFYALGTPEALSALATAPAVSAPREPGPVLRVLARAPKLGRVELTIEGQAALRVGARIESEDPAAAAQLEKQLEAVLQRADVQREKSRRVMASALEEVKGSVARDPEAPDRMKAAVAGATVERLVDPRGEWAALRNSIQVARTGNTVTAELTIPEAQVRRVARLDQGMTTVATIGILSAIAIPNFVKYQCRAKASEGQAAVQAARDAVKAHRTKDGRYPASLQQADYRPAPGGRYTVCMRSGCAPPAKPDAAKACEEALQSVSGGSKAPALCAAANLMDDGKMDVWLIDAPGDASNHRSACQ